MKKISPRAGLSTLLTHFAEEENPLGAHVAPIYQTSTFSFPDVATSQAVIKGEKEGFLYTRTANPNAQQLARRLAALEGFDLLQAHPEQNPDALVAGKMFASGMAAISAGILARLQTGGTVIVQDSLYSGTFAFFHDLAPALGISVVWIHDLSPDSWADAFRRHPGASLAYAETPANPMMNIVDLAAVAQIAHEHAAWLMVDNTFATPFCQRPITLGADMVVHSTTKYLSGHGTIIGGVVVSRHDSFVRTELHAMLKILGGSPSPFDCWLTNLGLKTFELRMLRHCENATVITRHLENHPKVARVYYPGLESHPGHATARRQMHHFGGMLSFELKGGMQSCEKILNQVRLATLAVSLGNVDTLIQHPASMTHHNVPPEDRLKMGITDGLLRFSVGIENAEDILADLEQALVFA